jgi:hypothetical protein
LHLLVPPPLPVCLLLLALHQLVRQQPKPKLHLLQLIPQAANSRTMLLQQH